MVENAAVYAIVAHGDQKYGDLPYAYHLARVVATLERWIPQSYAELRDAAWLHDVIEDTHVDKDAVEEKFGRLVAEYVWACTGVGENRKERNKSIYEKLQKCPDAVVIKLADRIVNLEEGISERNINKLSMYVKEDCEFYAAIVEHSRSVDERHMLQRYDDLIDIAMEMVDG